MLGCVCVCVHARVRTCVHVCGWNFSSSLVLYWLAKRNQYTNEINIPTTTYKHCIKTLKPSIGFFLFCWGSLWRLNVLCVVARSFLVATDFSENSCTKKKRKEKKKRHEKKTVISVLHFLYELCVPVLVLDCGWTSFPLSASVLGICAKRGWCNFQGYCYKLEQTPSTFKHAELSCQNQKAYLTDIFSREENNFVAALSSPASAARWIGMTYRWRERSWVWINGNRPFGGGYRPWAASVHSGPSRDCAYQKANSFGQEYFWTAGLCNAKKLFVCKKGQSLCFTC